MKQSKFIKNQSTKDIRINFFKKGLNIYKNQINNDLLQQKLIILKLSLSNINDAIYNIANDIELPENYLDVKNSYFYLSTSDEAFLVDIPGDRNPEDVEKFEMIIYNKLKEIQFINKKLPLSLIDDLIDKFGIDIISVLHYINKNNAYDLLQDKLQFINVLIEVKRKIVNRIKRVENYELHREKIELVSYLLNPYDLIYNNPFSEN